MCYTYIYDTLVYPLAIDHLVKDSIHPASVHRCAEIISKCFERALSNFDNDPFFFVTNDIEFMIRFRTERDPDVREFMNDQLVWNEFQIQYPKSSEELKFAVQVCLDNSITKNVISKIQIIKQFLMHKFRTLLSCLGEIHTGHTKKQGFENAKSLDSVPFHKIAEIRSKAGLPLPILQDTVIQKTIIHTDASTLRITIRGETYDESFNGSD